jgi:hypothetical protein
VIAAIYRHETGVSVIDDWDGFGQKTTGSGTLKGLKVSTAACAIPVKVARWTT